MFIHTENFIIQTPTIADYKNLENLYNDSSVMQYIPTVLKHWDSNLIKEKILKYQKENIGIHIVKSHTDEFIGEASIFNYETIDNVYEIGFIIQKSYWGIGLGTLICNTLINYCFQNLSAKQVIARMLRNNLACKRVCIKSGMTLLDETVEDKLLRRFTFSITK